MVSVLSRKPSFHPSKGPFDGLKELAKGQKSHKDHVHCYVKSRDANDGPADFVLDLWVVKELCEGDKVIGGSDDTELVEDLQAVKHRFFEWLHENVINEHEDAVEDQQLHLEHWRAIHDYCNQSEEEPSQHEDHVI